MKQIIVIVLLNVLALHCFAQADSTNIRIATIKWNAYEFLDSVKGTYVEHDSYFITHGEGNIDWHQIQGGQEKVTSFLVTNVVGTWANVNSPGTISYYATLNEIEGKLVFKRDGDWIIVQLVFDNTNAGQLNYAFTISSFENL